MIYGDDQAPPVAYQRTEDAANPAAVAFARHRLNQLVQAHLLGAMPQNMTDPTLVWRQLSATLAQNPQALSAFLAAGRPAVTPQSIAQTVVNHLPSQPAVTPESIAQTVVSHLPVQRHLGGYRGPH